MMEELGKNNDRPVGLLGFDDISTFVGCLTKKCLAQIFFSIFHRFRVVVLLNQ